MVRLGAARVFLESSSTPTDAHCQVIRVVSVLAARIYWDPVSTFEPIFLVVFSRQTTRHAACVTRWNLRVSRLALSRI